MESRRVWRGKYVAGVFVLRIVVREEGQRDEGGLGVVNGRVSIGGEIGRGEVREKVLV
jgi:hypothetical protein